MSDHRGDTEDALRRRLAHVERALNEQQRIASIGSWERNLTTGVSWWSENLYLLHGYEPGSFTPDQYTMEEFVVPEDLDRIKAWFREVEAAGGRELEDRFWTETPGGVRRLLEARARLFVDAQTGERRLVGISRDITEIARAKERAALLSQIVDSANQAIFTLDRDRHVTSWNPACERLYGYTEEEMMTSHIERLYPSDLSETVRSDVRDHVARMLNGEITYLQYEARRCRKDGTVIDVDVSWAPLRSPTGEITGMVVFVVDLTERKREAARTAFLMSHDRLTGLPSRSGFTEILEHTLETIECGALLVIDVDDFKYVNDTYGHECGDAMIARLATHLAAELSPDDQLGRIGGDTFGVLAPGADPVTARERAERLLAAVREHTMPISGEQVRVSVSIGVACFEQQVGKVSELLSDADRAMYIAKEAGRDRINVLSDAERIRSRLSPQTASDHAIRKALAENRLELYAQPIVDLATGRMSHCEALLRMRGRDGEIIGPGAFLPAAERSGLIHTIDRWVIEHAIAAATLHPDLTFEINLSASTLDDPDLAGFVAQHLEANDLDPSRIVFELTETAAVSSLGNAKNLATRLSAIGCGFAIDDFGAGFSTFYYLKHFPARYVKIDGEFTTGSGNRMDELVIESIVRISHEVGKLTIAEYVEDQESLERVRNLGVDYGQGYLFAKPFPIAELATFPRQLLDEAAVPR